MVDTCLWVAVVATALLDLKARAPKGSKMVDDVQVVNRRLDASGNEALIGMPTE